MSTLLLNFPLPVLQNKCNIIHFPNSFSIRLNHLTVNLHCLPLPSQLHREFFPDLMPPLSPVFVQFVKVLIWLRTCLLCPTGILCTLIQRWIKTNILTDLPWVIRLLSALQLNLQSCAATVLQEELWDCPEVLLLLHIWLAKICVQTLKGFGWRHNPGLLTALGTPGWDIQFSSASLKNLVTVPLTWNKGPGCSR